MILILIKIRKLKQKKYIKIGAIAERLMHTLTRLINKMKNTFVDFCGQDECRRNTIIKKMENVNLLFVDQMFARQSLKFFCRKFSTLLLLQVFSLDKAFEVPKLYVQFDVLV